MTQINLPFQVGQNVEVKSFIEGYRGAWFRCKIMDITNGSGVLRYKLEYLDFPEEALDDAKVFETPEGGTESHLMVRPTYPPHYLESEYLNLKGDLEEPLVVVHDSWKVGDLVDWWRDDCYWSGEIVAMKGKKSFQIELLPKPEGEGEIYRGLCKDLRPRLNWSVTDGWKVPCTVDGQKCAKLVNPKEDKEIADVCETGEEKTKKGTEQVKGDGGLRLNIMESDSIEAAVLDIEELIVRLGWLKAKLNPDLGEGAKSYWRYEDYRPSSSGR